MANVFAFTGTPGTGVQKALQKFSAYIKNQHEVKVKTICLDNYLWDAFKEEASNNLLLRKVTELDDVDPESLEKPDWWKLLALPIGGVRHYWNVAADRALDELANDDSDIVLVSFHACYYSDEYRWRICAADPMRLSKFQFKAFITLIDDVYDIHRRREQHWQGFSLAPESKEERATELIEFTIKSFSQYISFRQDEIILSDLFAASCGNVPSHVFAVKHPASTLAQLIENPDQTVYFSHPITKIRNKKRFTETDAFKEISHQAAALRSRFAMIEPTSIDEARIKAVQVPPEDKTPLFPAAKVKSTEFLPRLSQRWPLLAPADNLLVGPLDDASIDETPIVFPEIAEHFDLRSEIEDFSNGQIPATFKERITIALEQLYNRISDDITWRDHHLVDQTKRLVVYRPTVEGTPSGGVKREVEYFYTLPITTTSQLKAVIYHPEEDEIALAEVTARELLVKWRSLEVLRKSFKSTGKLDENRLLGDLITTLRSKNNSSAKARQLVQSLEKYLNLTPNQTPKMNAAPMDTGGVAANRKAKDEMRKDIRRLTETTVAKNYYLTELLSNRPDFDVIFAPTGVDLGQAIIQFTNNE